MDNLNTIPELTDKTFEDTIQSGTALVYFYSQTCGTCRQQEPVVRQVAAQAGNRAAVAKIDIDAAPAVGRAHKIHYLPMVKIYKDGAETQSFIGLKDAPTLLAALDAAT